MPREMDLVRELLLRLDAIPRGGLHILNGCQEEVAIPGYEPETINQHLELLADAGFVDSPGSQPADGGITFKGITWKGYDFLDSVRDPEVWKRTKDGASKVGSWSVDLLKDMGKAYAKLKAKEVLGLDL